MTTTVLDLRAKARLAPEVNALLQNTALRLRRDFTACIDTLTRKLHGDVCWLFSTPASRNPITSGLLHHCSALAMLEDLAAADALPERVLTDSPALAQVLEAWLRTTGRCTKVELHKPKTEIRAWLRFVARIAGDMAWQIWTLAACRLSGSSPPPRGQGLVLIDTYVLRDTPLEDRYFSGLWDSLNDDAKRRTRFVPTVYGNGFRGFFAMYGKLRRSGRFLLKEDFLGVGDLLTAAARTMRSMALAIPETPFRAFDIGPMIRQELRRCGQCSSMLSAFLTMAFVKRLRQAGVEVERTLCWYENQNIDKAWNIAFSRWYPKVLRTGYQGFTPSPLHLSLFPTQTENSFGALPQRVAVMGRALVRGVGEFCPGLEVLVAPAFRYDYVHSAPEGACDMAQKRILVALSGMHDAADDTLAMLGQALDSLDDDVEILVKPHPILEKWPELERRHLAGSPRLRRVDGGLPALLPGCRLLVSAASSACMEALALGIPVAVVAPGAGGLVLNPLPEDLAGRAWWMCYTGRDLAAVIARHVAGEGLSPDMRRDLARTTRAGYFSPATRARAAALVLGDDAPA